MYQFLESIKLLNGELYHLSWHQKRVDATFLQFFPNTKALDLYQKITAFSVPKDGLYKVRITYSSELYSIEFVPYKMRKIQSFELKEIDFEYGFKFENREKIDALSSQKQADEVIFTQSDFILDSSYANIALFDGNEWVTPNTFLLNGTTRQRLITEKKLIEREIKIQDFSAYQKISFINALNDLGENMLDLRL